MTIEARRSAARSGAQGTVVAVLAAISVCHMLNDVIQSLIMAIYPMLKENLTLDFGQIGLITFTFQFTASVLQPGVGYVTDRYPTPYSLVLGMGSSLIGLILIAFASSYASVLAAAALIGMGSSVFHPESSRVARLASGGRHGMAQSVFQVGGNFGTALGPLLAAFIVLPYGQHTIVWFSLVALLAMALLAGVGSWYGKTLKVNRAAPGKERKAIAEMTHGKVGRTIAILMALTFSKHFYLVSITSFYIFYLIHTFGLSVQSAQLYLFVFLAAVAAGTVIGGPIGDRIGARRVIWWSILGVLPFTLALPYADLFWTAVLSVIIGVTLASAFPQIIVYAQGLLPGRVGMVAGLFFGLAFGIAGIGAAFLGWLADETSIAFVYHICAFLPAIGLLAAFLPETAKPRVPATRGKR
ncbi:MAG TPA: MFS transporter [Rhizobiales bacterium]|jgi:MFS transporter, FSR family, fosmidomycin resistance protein|nr:MFS transporter [Hyphomicrobiales bacterium]HAN64241.1 MFS transporter [Hyphomicrobiales bacterium]HBH42375.1 MFS transporter [Hyphomicrobiales bacterium]HBR25698.1 MFS transporter [Hyphomicrobiales bacterium]HCL62535.1 MFS transporter [Hyphomicrobiales bacterium]